MADTKRSKREKSKSAVDASTGHHTAAQSPVAGPYAAGALTGDDPVSAASISSIEPPFVSKPKSQKATTAWAYQKAKKSNAGPSAPSVAFGLM